MALEYLRQDLINTAGESSPTTKGRPPKRKLSKGKLSLLVGGNLIVWVIFIVSIMDINVFSMNSVSMPKMPQKLAVSGIVYNEQSPSVIISNQVYSLGDVVDGYAISRITRTEVEFQKGRKKLIRKVR